MSGIKGISRLPRDTVRARRNATQLASNFTDIIGDGLEITGVGLLAIDLAANKGLEFVTGDLATKIQSPLICDAAGLGIDPGDGIAVSGTELVVDLTATPGLEFSAGDLQVKVVDPINRGVGGLGLNLDADYLWVDAAGGVSIINPITANIVSSNDITAATFTATNAINEFSTDGTLVGNSDVALPTEQAVKTYVDMEIATRQPLDADLTSIAILGTVADIMIYTTAAHVWAETALTVAGRAILDDANAADQCDTLGLGAADAVGFGSVTTGALTIGALNGVLLAGAGVVGGGAGIADLANVTIAAVADNEVLTYDNATSQWINQTAAEAGVASAGRLINSGDGLSGGGDLSADRTLVVDLTATPGLEISGAKLQAKVNTARQMNRAAAGLELRGTYANTTENYNAAQSAATIQTAIDLLPKYIAEDVTLTIQFADGTYTLSHVLSFRGFWGPGILALEGNAGESGLHMNQAVDLDFSGQDCHGIDLIGITCQYVSVTNLDVKIKTDVAHYAAIRIVGSVSTVYTDGCYLHGTSNTKGWGMHASANSYIRPYATYVGTIYAGLRCDFSKGFSRDVDDDAANPPQYGLVAYNNSTIGKRSTQPAGSVANELTGYGSVIR